MELPKYNHNLERKKMVKYCQYQDCGKEFIGIPVQKYCEFHVNPHHRKRKRPKRESPDIKNQIFRHFYMDKTLVEFSCAMAGCNSRFNVEVIPRQYVYPKYCETHRNEFRRKIYERLHRSKKEIAFYKPIIQFT